MSDPTDADHEGPARPPDQPRPGSSRVFDGEREDRTGPTELGSPRSPRSGAVLHDDDGYDEFFDFDGNRRDYVRIPRRAPELPSFLGWRLLVKLLVIAALILSGIWVYHQVNPSGEPGEAVTVDVPSGANVAVIADILDDAGVISNSRLFQEYTRFKSSGLIKAGSYQMNKRMALWEALDVLEAGPAPAGAANVLVPEGLRLSEILALLPESIPRFSEESVSAAASSGAVTSRYQPPDGSLEGLLFPDTYQVPEDADEVAALQLMATQFEAVADEIQLDTRAQAMGYTPQQIITIASMIEEEARVDEDRTKIARVIYNRLAAGTRLDIDATTLYAVGKEGNTLTQSDLDSDSPYNTRKVAGLPPGPIASPGRASLEAALSPVDGPWFYYVLADEDGHHAFTDDPDEFERLVAEAEEKGLLG
jgi:UPF0755 protein